MIPDPARHDRMVETMLTTADSLRLTAYGLDEDEMRVVAAAADSSRPTADGREGP